MQFIRQLITIYLLLPVSVLAGQPSNSWLQLYKLNQASQQELEKIQRTYADRSVPFSVQKGLTQQQRLEQSALQESQRRKQIILNHRQKHSPTGRQDRTKTITQQQRFRIEQQNQLSRFRIQQQMRPWRR